MKERLKVIKDYIKRIEDVPLDSIEHIEDVRALLKAISIQARYSLSDVRKQTKRFRADLPSILRARLKRVGRLAAALQMSKSNEAGVFIWCWVDRDTPNQLVIKFERTAGQTRAQTEAAFHAYLDNVL